MPSSADRPPLTTETAIAPTSEAVRLESLQEASRRLPRISPEASLAYQDYSEAIATEVARRLLSRDDIRQLVRPELRAVMRASHRAHVKLIRDVLRSMDYAHLARTLPKLWRNDLKHGLSIDYLAVTLDAFRAAVKRVLNSAYFAEVDAIYRWIQEQYEVIVALSTEPSITQEQGTVHLPDVNQFAELLLSGSTRKCWASIRDAISDEIELKDFSLNVLQPALYEIGHRWETGQISIAHEHLASAVAGRIQSLIYERLAPTRERLGSALVAAPPNEYHEIGPRMVADFLELDGWVTHYFGANTPSEDLMRFVRAYPVYLVMISVTMPFNLAMCRNLVDAVRAEGASRSLKVMVGGQAFATAATHWQSIGADGYAPNAEEAVNLARQWWTEREARS